MMVDVKSNNTHMNNTPRLTLKNLSALFDHIKNEQQSVIVRNKLSINDFNYITDIRSSKFYDTTFVSMAKNDNYMIHTYTYQKNDGIHMTHVLYVKKDKTFIVLDDNDEAETVVTYDAKNDMFI